MRFPFLAPCFRIRCTLSQSCTPRSTSARTSASDYLTLLVENHDVSSEELEIDVNQAASNLNLETSIETTLKNSIVLCRELQTFNQDCTKAKARPISLPSGLDIRKQLCTKFKELKVKYRDLTYHDDIDVEMI